MSAPEVTYEDALTVLGTLPYIAPRPTATNIRVLVIDLLDKLTIITSQKSSGFWYSGMIEADAVYALKTTTAC